MGTAGWLAGLVCLCSTSKLCCLYFSREGFSLKTLFGFHSLFPTHFLLDTSMSSDSEDNSAVRYSNIGSKRNRSEDSENGEIPPVVKRLNTSCKPKLLCLFPSVIANSSLCVGVFVIISRSQRRRHFHQVPPAQLCVWDDHRECWLHCEQAYGNHGHYHQVLPRPGALPGHQRQGLSHHGLSPRYLPGP